MVTGDHPATARAIADELDVGEADGLVMRGDELARSSPEELEALVPRLRVVARATPAHKLLVVEALDACGQVVGMTGDGVNDAPALKAASIGIAMGEGGTDVARAAADLVLADDNYATIVAAIEEGRTVYGNVQRFILFLVSINVGLVVAVFVAPLIGWGAILTPTQILWINLVTNGLPALALGMEPAEAGVMNEPPRRREAGPLGRSDLSFLVGYGLLMAGLGLLGFGLMDGEDPEKRRVAQTFAFTVLAFGPLFHALNCRSRNRSVFGLAPNRVMWAFSLVAVGLQAVAVYVPGLGPMFSTVPLSATELGAAVGLSAIVWIVGEVVKLALKFRARLA
jgi:Ca2+-transporting ATPase